MFLGEELFEKSSSPNPSSKTFNLYTYDKVQLKFIEN